MATEHIRTAVSGGALRRSRVVYMSDDYKVLEMSVNTSFAPFGILQEYCRYAPGTPFDTSLQAATASGQEVLVYCDGATAIAECGGTVTAGKLVTSDSTARIVDVGGAPPFSMYVVGRALEDGAAGDVIRIEVIIR